MKPTKESDQMIRNIKVLGLAFVAVAAMSAIVASSAFASEIHINTPQKANLTGEQTTEHKFQITANTGPSTTCANAHFEGTVEGGSPQITKQDVEITGLYTNCQAFGLSATVKMNGCKYTLTGTGKPALTVNVDITGCTVGQQIQIIVPGCTISVPEQSGAAGAGLPHIVFSQVGQHANANITVTGITYQVSGPLCGHTNNVLTHDGTYHGSATFKAFQDLGTQLVQHTEHHQYNKLINGPQIGLTVT